MITWRPIETAPENTVVQVYCPWFPAGTVARGKYKNGRWSIAYGMQQGMRIEHHPEFWMPLPKPPS